jgi:uncharacterized protein
LAYNHLMLSKRVGITQNGNEKSLTTLQKIMKDDIVWTLDKNEKVLSKEERDKLPPDIRKLAFQYKDGYIVVTDGSQFMNHSCDPNLWWKGDESLIAKRDITKGEELTYDYSTADVGDWVAGWDCMCGSDNCRKRITGNDCLSKDFRNNYKGHLPSWVLEYIKYKNQTIKK